MAEIVTAIRQVAQGRVYVTPLIAGSFISTLMDEGRPPEGRKALTVRQREVLQLLAEGKTMKEVASVLGISTRTAESHKYEIMRQLGIDTTAQLVHTLSASNWFDARGPLPGGPRPAPSRAYATSM